MKRIAYMVMLVLGIIGMGCPQGAVAQSLPALPVAPQIKVGTLDNGIHYYLVGNSLDKGTVSMALVQRTGYQDEDASIVGQTIVHSRGALSDLPRFQATSPFSFMNRKSLFPGDEGYVSVKENATIYRFDNVTAAGSREVLDSTLLMIFDIISLSTQQSDRYPTESQAIIVAGDIDQNAFLSKMNMLALLVPKKGERKQETPYVWKENEERQFHLIPPVKPGHASVLVQYSAPRTPLSGMNTVQSLMSEKLANELNIIIQNRLSDELRRRRIPCSSLNSTYLGSTRHNKDEKIRVVVSTDDVHVADVMEVLGSILSDLDRNGAGLPEYKDVQNEFKIGLGEVYDHIVRLNSNFVDKCISSFLYNSPLSSAQENYDFLFKRVLDPEVELSLFNNYIQAVLDVRKNLTLVCSTGLPEEVGDELENKFAAAWQEQESAKPHSVSYNQEADELKRSFSKTKIKVEAVEPMTGGKIWTFSNGMRVIYKQAGKENIFHYELLLKTGFSQAANIRNGEKAFLSDILAMNQIAGMGGAEFCNMLNANGISMMTEVSISDLVIQGTAPVDQLPLLLRSLLAIGYDRKPDPKSFSYYKECADLQIDFFRNSKPGRLAVLDSLLCPSMNVSPYRRKINFDDHFPVRAGRFYDNVFSKASDGVLILVGQFDEEQLKKDLCRHIGGFKSENVSTIRARRQEGFIEGRSLLVRESRHPSLDLMFDTPINYTAENFMNIKIAAMGMEDALAKTAARMGWTLTTNGKFIMFPEEKFNFTVQMTPARISGLPASMVQQYDVEQLLEQVDAAIDRIAAEGITSGQFNTYKSMLSSMLDEDMKDPTLIPEFLVMRYSYGKDLMTRYQQKLGALQLDKANAFLKDMATGAIAQYAVRGGAGGEKVRESILPQPYLAPSAPSRPARDTTGIVKLYRSLFQE